MTSALRITFPSTRVGVAGWTSYCRIMGLVIELKHTRDVLTDKSLGEQLMIDRDRYVNARTARHMIALVFDPTRVLENSAGLERDLQRKVGTAELAVSVRIFH